MLTGMRTTTLVWLAAIPIALTACGTAQTTTGSSPGISVSGAPSSHTPPPPTEVTSPVATTTPEPLAWTRLEADGPAAREDHTWVLDADAEMAYLFGGRDGTTVYDDTWAFDLNDDTWTQLAPATAPPARFGHEAVWVDGVGVVVFAGQADAQTFFNDLWAFDPAANTWVELPAGGALPTPRYGTCAAIGPDGRLWISHGFTEDQARFSDTVAYDFADAAWANETPASGARPVERCLHGCWWTDGGELALYAGQTTGITALDDRWVLAGGSWSRVDGEVPPARNLYARARHAGATLVFGGQAIDGEFLSDLWLLEDSAGDARAVEPDGEPPPGRAGGELIVDAARRRGILFGGRNADGSLHDLWILTGL
jgi:hypothetical protein